MYSIVSVLLVLWLVGFLAHFGGSLIHGLLLLAGVLFIVELASGKRLV